jgi:hypothetical protein
MHACFILCCTQTSYGVALHTDRLWCGVRTTLWVNQVCQISVVICAGASIKLSILVIVGGPKVEVANVSEWLLTGADNMLTRLDGV